MNVKRDLVSLSAALVVAVAWAFVPVGAVQGAPPSPSLWYGQPANNWNEALPVGNGRLGVMVFGGILKERFQLNEDSLWAGAPQDADNPLALQALPEIRRLLFEGNYADAESLANRTLICKGPGSNGGRGRHVAYGSYQTLGDLTLDFPGDTNSFPISYRRELDLATAVARVSYEMKGVRYEREVFASHPDQVLVVRLTANKEGALNFRATLSRPEAAAMTNTAPNELVMRGQLWDGAAWEGMKYAARLRVVNTDGKVTAEGGALKIEGARKVTLLLAAATDYQMQLPDWRQGDPETKTKSQMDAAAARSYRQLRRAHVADYQELFDRVRLDLGGAVAAQLPTDERLRAVIAGSQDPALIALYFQFGRYLLISSSRAGDLPANLQGIWADGISPPWSSDYHANINLEMNYWPAEVANLSECFEPYTRYVEFLTKPGAHTAKVHYNARGWTTHTLGNVWGFTAPGESPSWGLSPSSGAWLARQLWEHFEFTQDTNYLRRVLPVLRGSAEFSLDWLVEDPKSVKLVAGPAPSPENKFITADGAQASLTMGPAMEQQIVADAFENYLAGVRVLDLKEEAVMEVKKAQVQLLVPRVGKDGRLLEWMEPFKEAEPGHRHMSHLFALFPGNEITLRGTPELAAAARKSLEYRLANGGGHRGWSRAWIVNFWARLGDGNQALENLQALLAKCTLPNLFDNYPPFQIDGNFGGTAGICEMLVQSHADEIEVLPALPKAWRTGSVKGLRARGGYEVDIAWKDGQLATVKLRNIAGEGRCTLRHGNKTVVLKLAKGKAETLDGNLQPK